MHSFIKLVVLLITNRSKNHTQCASYELEAGLIKTRLCVHFFQWDWLILHQWIFYYYYFINFIIFFLQEIEKGHSAAFCSCLFPPVFTLQEQKKSSKLEESMKMLDYEMKKTDDLLYRMIPKPVAKRLRKGEPAVNTCEVRRHNCHPTPLCCLIVKTRKVTFIYMTHVETRVVRRYSG